jgi:hypothetical protein
MDLRSNLTVGRFYWVIAAPGLGIDWQDEIQPARFNGWNAEGEMQWNFMGVAGSSNWSVLWVGEAIDVPIAPTARRM